MVFARRVRKFNKVRHVARTKRLKERKTPSFRTVMKAVNKITRTIETKSGVTLIPDNMAFQHNNLNMVNNTFMRTSNNGLNDMEDGPVGRASSE